MISDRDQIHTPGLGQLVDTIGRGVAIHRFQRLYVIGFPTEIGMDVQICLQSWQSVGSLGRIHRFKWTWSYHGLHEIISSLELQRLVPTEAAQSQEKRERAPENQGYQMGCLARQTSALQNDGPQSIVERGEW